MNKPRVSRRTAVVVAAVLAVLLVGGGVAVARTVLAAPVTSVAVTVPAAASGYGAPVEVRLQLRADDEPLAGSLTVDVADSTTSVRTDARGRATMTVPAASLTVGKHPLTASYAKTTDHPAGRGAATITVVAATSAVSVTTPNDAAGAPTMQAAVTTSTGVPAEGSVAFSVAGQPAGSAPVANGVATVPAPPGLALGDHQVAASFTPKDPTSVTGSEATSTMSVTLVSAGIAAATTTPVVTATSTTALSP